MEQPLNNQNDEQKENYNSDQNDIYINQGQPPQEEEVPPTKQNYCPPPQNGPKNQNYYQPPPQDPNVPAQPVTFVGAPIQSNIGLDTPIQQGIPVNNYPQDAVVPQPIQYNNVYQQYTNISQIKHRGIYQKDENNFYVSIGCCFKSVRYIVILLGLGIIGAGFFLKPKINPIFPIIIGAIVTVIGVFRLFFYYDSIYFIMGSNNLTIIKKASCRKKTNIYNPGELQRIEFTQTYTYGDITFNGGYTLTVVPTNGEPDTILSIGTYFDLFTRYEIEYFSYYINNHIQTNMRV